MTARRLSIEELRPLVGQELGVGEWVEVTQDQVQRFADATGDRQWIHCDPQRAGRESPYGTTIAHGLLTLSLGPALVGGIVEFAGVRLVVNYGLNRVRFPAAVRVGRRVRLRLSLLQLEDVPDGVQLTMAQIIEVEGETKPACVAECVWRLVPGE